MTQSRGERFVGSLQDGRKVWLNGRIVQDVTGHSAFAGTIRTIRELFDSLDDPEFRDRVGFISPKTGRHVHKSFLVPTSYEDLLSKRDAYQLWANWSNGVMSRLSESGRSYITGWYAARESFRKYDNAFPDKIARYYEQVRDEDRIVISVQLDPPVDRSRNSLSEDPDSLLHIVKVTGDGVVIRGAKVMATAAPYAHDIIVSSNQQLQEDLPQYAYMISVPLNASGIHIVCREPFSSEDKEEHPISHRYDEMDATVIFDDVFVSWDRVFLHHNPEGVWLARIHQRDNTLANHQMVVRLAAKLEFVADRKSVV